MAAERRSRRLALLAAALAVAGALPPAASAEDAPGMFVVLQSAYYTFAQAGPTDQAAGARVVLIEQTSPANGSQAEFQHNASGALITAKTREQLVVVEYQVPLGQNPLAAPSASDRFHAYYKADLVPTSIVDGTRRIVAFANNTPATLASTYDAAAAVPATASIRAEGGIVLGFGHLDAEATATGDLSGTRAYLNAVLVEDPVSPPSGGGELRFVARAWLGSLRLEGGHASGRFNFTTSPSWVESRLAVVLFVQSDGATEGTPPPGPTPAAPDLFVEVSPAIMVAVLGALVLIFARRARPPDR